MNELVRASMITFINLNIKMFVEQILHGFPGRFLAAIFELISHISCVNESVMYWYRLTFSTRSGEIQRIIDIPKPCSTYPLMYTTYEYYIPSTGRGVRTSFRHHANLRHQIRFPSWESAEIISKTLIRRQTNIPPPFQG